MRSQKNIRNKGRGINCSRTLLKAVAAGTIILALAIFYAVMTRTPAWAAEDTPPAGRAKGVSREHWHAQGRTLGVILIHLLESGFESYGGGPKVVIATTIR